MNKTSSTEGGERGRSTHDHLDTGAVVQAERNKALNRDPPKPPVKAVRPTPFDRVAIAPTDVRFLALEGGGGKGMAYLGALEALEKLGGLKDIRGCAGASAGAITALLLVLGYTPAQLRTYLTGPTADFTKFFDPPQPRYRPVPGGPYEEVKELSQSEQRTLIALSISSVSLVPGALKVFAESSPLAVALLSMVTGEPVADLAELRKVVDAYTRKEPYKGLLAGWKEYFAALPTDMGLFSGQAARQEFDALIRKAIRARHPNMSAEELDRRPAITFRDLRDLGFTRRLVLTAANLSTGRTELFSAEHTECFPVADAVRISMSLPFIYKPYILAEERPGYPPCGTYVDGGLWNNLPYREVNPKGVSATLALRLEILAPEAVHTMGQLLARVATFGLFGTGESQVLRDYEANMIKLDTRGLDLVDFSPPPDQRDKAIKRAARAVYYAFEEMPPKEFRDNKDDIESAQLRMDARLCVARTVPGL